jgi:hypothetical protein
LLGRGRNRSISGAIVFCALLGLAGCDNYNQSIEDFIYYQTGTVLPQDQARVLSPPAEQEADGSFHVRAANAEIVLELDLKNDRGYDLRFEALNNGAAAEAVQVEPIASDRVLIRIAGAKPGDEFRIVLQVVASNGYRSFGAIKLPVIYCDAPLSGAKELLSFAFGSWTGTINESAKTVAVTVPYGTVISGIIPVVTVSNGADYSPKEAWGSGSSKTYTVTAADGASAAYVVTVSVAGQGSISVTFSGIPQDENTDLTGTTGGSLDWLAGSLILNAPGAGIFSGAAYQWYLDGRKLAGETTGSYGAAGSAFTLGRHQATALITTSTGIVYVKAIVFVVE